MKKFYKYIAVVTIVAAAGFTAYSTQGNKLHLSSLAMENVEALARGESGGGADPNVSYGYELVDCWDKSGKNIIGARCMQHQGFECHINQTYGRCSN